MSVERIHQEVDEIVMQVEATQRIQAGNEDLLGAIADTCWCRYGQYHDPETVCSHCLGVVRR